MSHAWHMDSGCLDNHVAAVSLYVMHYNFCRVHETLRATPAVALGLCDRPLSIGDLLDAALKVVPDAPAPITPPERRRQLRVIEGGKK